MILMLIYIYIYKHLYHNDLIFVCTHEYKFDFKNLTKLRYLYNLNKIFSGYTLLNIFIHEYGIWQEK